MHDTFCLESKCTVIKRYTCLRRLGDDHLLDDIHNIDEEGDDATPHGKDEDEQRSLFGDHDEEWRKEESSGFRRQARRP